MYKKLLPHIGHSIVCVCYGNPKKPENVAVECEDCNEVLCDGDRHDSRTDLFLVCMDPTFVRDSQMLDTTGISDEFFREMDPFDESKEDLWHDMEPTPYIATVAAVDEEDACKQVAKKYRYDARCLFAQQVRAEF